MSSTIKNRLKALRNAKGLTQDELVLKLNSQLNSDEKPISKMTVSNWENNKHAIKQDKAKLLADFFGVSVPYLLGYEEEPLLEDIAQELSSYVTKEEWEIIHSDPAQEQYYMSLAWERMLEANREPSRNVVKIEIAKNTLSDAEFMALPPAKRKEYVGEYLDAMSRALSSLTDTIANTAEIAADITGDQLSNLTNNLIKALAKLNDIDKKD